MHVPVLPEEINSFLNIRANLVYVDCTLGMGGHSLNIAQALDNSGLLVGLDWDEDILKIAKERLSIFKNCYLFHSNYTELKEVLNELHITKITGGLLLDLGVNSLHLDMASRGFSFQNDAQLDMRMDKTQSPTAYKIINTYREDELANMIFKYGEDRYSRKIAKSVIYTRKKTGPIKSTKELANLILGCYPKGRYFKTHPATRTFQALRIEVNKELENLERFLCFIPELLSPGARLCVISFHSLEDRIIKIFLRNNKDFKTLTKKPIIPSYGEVKTNPRARSAKLRVAEKL